MSAVPHDQGPGAAGQGEQGGEGEEEELQPWAVPQPGEQRKVQGSQASGESKEASQDILGPIDLSGRLDGSRLGNISAEQHQAAMAVLLQQKPALQLTSDSSQPAESSKVGDTLCHTAAGAQQRFSRAAAARLRPVAVGCVGPPFHRYLRHDSARASEAEAHGAGWYSVRQPEVRDITLQGGLAEVHDCMAAWPSRRLVLEQPLATLTTPGLAAPAAGVQKECAPEQACVQPTPWHVELSSEAQQHLQQKGARKARVPGAHVGSSGFAAAGALAQAVHHLAAWLPNGLLCPPAAVVDALSLGAPQAVTDTDTSGLQSKAAHTQPNSAHIVSGQQQQAVLDTASCSQWASARVCLRWCSPATHEPLRWDPADRVVVQVGAWVNARVVAVQRMVR
jgi:hypothetical protein